MKKLLVCFVALVVAALMLITLNKDTAQPYQETVRGIPVIIIGEKNRNVERYLQDIDYIDDDLILLAEQIVFTDNPAVIEAEIVDGNEKANAITLPKQNIIYINTDSYDSLTLLHEFYHLFDWNEGDISNNKEFQKMMQIHDKCLNLSAYEASNFQESFVALLMRYRYKNEELKNKCPEMYQYAQKLLNENG